MNKKVLLTAVAVLVLFLLARALAWTSAYYTERAKDAGRSTLLLVSEAVDQAVGRFAPIPGLIADEPTLRRMLKQDTGQGFAPFMNEKLRQIALSIDASEIYVTDRSGLTVAASNYRDDDSFLGNNYVYRPYFTEPLEGKSAFFHALGIVSGERGFFFSAPILDGIDVLGVLVVKITVGDIEQDWLGINQEVLIADNNGIVFLTSREDYKYGALAPLTEAVRARIADTRQFPLERVVPIDLSADVIGPETVRVTINRDTHAEQYLAASAPLELTGWHAIVFTPMGPVQNQVYWSMALGALALTAALLAVLVIVQRRAHILQKIRIEQDQRALLEVKVLERTAVLDTANATMRQEVTERRNAEERLRKSQKELVQAGKLAALGQMSAAISHEINQPLAAIKSYAVNASEYLSRSRLEEARSNIDSISEMSDRMAEISNHLRNFARQPGDTLKPINVSEVIAEMMGLVGPQLRASNVEIKFTPPNQPIWALGGKLRLQQVLVNIVTNALEAMSGQKNPIVEIDVAESGGKVQVNLRDHGPGVPKEDLEQVFDAFYTTKTAGAGMGLGMSISQNIISDFGGVLSVENHPEGGAIFTDTLQPCDAETSSDLAS